MKQAIGVLGGTFNPIHYGHLRMAQELADALNLAEVRFIPSANPPHKTAPVISAQHRANMLQLAIADNPLFKLDTRELDRTGASYTIDTLTSLRKELGQQVPLCLMMGSDVFVQLDSWHRYSELLNHCHIVLVQRPNTAPQGQLSSTLKALLQKHYTENVRDLHENAAGYIHMQAITAQDISSTVIRKKLSQHISCQYLLQDNVLSYMTQHNL